MDETAPCRCQGQIASGRTPPARWLHRHEHGQGRRERRSLLQQYNKRGTCEQYIKEGKGAIKWTRLSCRSFAANAVRLQLHALASNLANFLRTLATPEPIKDRSMTTLKEKPIKIGAKVVNHVAISWPTKATTRATF